MTENADFLPNPVMVNSVISTNTSYFEQFTESDNKTFIEQFSTSMIKYIESNINNIEVSKYIKSFFDVFIFTAHARPRIEDKRPIVLPYTGTCMPGMKISVRTNGVFDICERINPHFPIGNVNDGFDYKKFVKIMKDYNKAVTKNCSYCPINKLCPICFAQACTDECFFSPSCDEIKQSFQMYFSILYSIKEENPDAFNEFERPLEWVLYN